MMFAKRFLFGMAYGLIIPTISYKTKRYINRKPILLSTFKNRIKNITDSEIINSGERVINNIYQNASYNKDITACGQSAAALLELIPEVYGISTLSNPIKSNIKNLDQIHKMLLDKNRYVINIDISSGETINTKISFSTVFNNISKYLLYGRYWNYFVGHSFIILKGDDGILLVQSYVGKYKMTLKDIHIVTLERHLKDLNYFVADGEFDENMIQFWKKLTGVSINNLRNQKLKQVSCQVYYVKL